MARRPDPARSRVLLIGATRFSSPGLDNIPEIRSGIHRLRRALTDPTRGVFDPATCTVVEPARSQRDVVDPFYAAVQSAEDVLLVYYAGHGILDRDAKLHLAVEESDPQRPFGNSVDFGAVKREMERADARLRILWLDCCYSGQAIGSQSPALLDGEATTEDVNLAVENQVITVSDDAIDGMYVLTSSGASVKSNYVPGEQATVFTGSLLAALDSEPDRELRLGELLPRVAAEVRRRGGPSPQAVASNTSASLVIRGPVAAAPHPAQGVVVPGGNGRRRMPRGATVGGIALAAAVAITAAVVTSGTPDGSTAGGTPPAATSTSLPAVPTSAVVPPTGDVVFSDDFDGAELDLGRWEAPNRPEHIRQQGGRLVLSTRPGEGVDYTNIEPIGLPQPFTEARFTVVIPPYATGGQGGGAFVLNPRGERPQLLALGPGGDGGVLVAPLTCDRAECPLDQYGTFTEPDFGEIPDLRPGDEVAVRITHENGRLMYRLNEQEVGATTVDPGPLTEFWFSVSAGEEESWDVEIDNLVIT